MRSDRSRLSLLSPGPRGLRSSTWRLPDHDAAVDELQRRVDQEVRLRGVSLCLEEVERVAVARRDAEPLRLAIEVDVLGLGLVHAAEVDREAAIDEDPQVVVAAEAKHLAARVLEARVQLEGE